MNRFRQRKYRKNKFLQHLSFRNKHVIVFLNKEGKCYHVSAVAHVRHWTNETWSNLRTWPIWFGKEKPTGAAVIDMAAGRVLRFLGLHYGPAKIFS